MARANGAAVTDRSLAVLIDFENLALGFPPRSKSAFDIHRVLDRLLEKGKVVAKVAYADWSRFDKYKEAYRLTSINDQTTGEAALPK